MPAIHRSAREGVIWALVVTLQFSFGPATAHAFGGTASLPKREPDHATEETGRAVVNIAPSPALADARCVSIRQFTAPLQNVARLRT
jgi:hypothetical protein